MENQKFLGAEKKTMGLGLLRKTETEFVSRRRDQYQCNPGRCVWRVIDDSTPALVFGQPGRSLSIEDMLW